MALMRVHLAPRAQFVVGLLLATAVSGGLLAAEWVAYGELVHQYLLWNLFLAWLPFGLALWLHAVLRRKLWSSWEALLVTIAWVVFLPNSFYMVSDFIHLNELATDQVLFGAVTFTSFVFTSLCLGISSLYIVHRELLRRARARMATIMVGVLLLVASAAIYVGRDLRWNSWDVVINPFGLLFDVSERLLHPSQYGQALAVILPFFALLVMMYFVVWQAIHAVQATHDVHYKRKES